MRLSFQSRGKVGNPLFYPLLYDFGAIGNYLRNELLLVDSGQYALQGCHGRNQCIMIDFADLSLRKKLVRDGHIPIKDA
jgi:hypothetical protein